MLKDFVAFALEMQVMREKLESLIATAKRRKPNYSVQDYLATIEWIMTQLESCAPAPPLRAKTTLRPAAKSAMDTSHAQLNRTIQEN